MAEWLPLNLTTSTRWVHLSSWEEFLAFGPVGSTHRGLVKNVPGDFTITSRVQDSVVVTFTPDAKEAVI